MFESLVGYVVSVYDLIIKGLFLIVVIPMTIYIIQALVRSLVQSIKEMGKEKK